MACYGYKAYMARFAGSLYSTATLLKSQNNVDVHYFHNLFYVNSNYIFSYILKNS